MPAGDCRAGHHDAAAAGRAGGAAGDGRCHSGPARGDDAARRGGPARHFRARARAPSLRHHGYQHAVLAVVVAGRDRPAPAACRRTGRAAGLGRLRRLQPGR